MNDQERRDYDDGEVGVFAPRTGRRATAGRSVGADHRSLDPTARGDTAGEASGGNRR